MEPEPIPAG